MKILALITARGGSKRVPGKNIRMLGGKPLIAWSMDVAKGIPHICDILVSTDDQRIADIAHEHGSPVPWLRPAALATDSASSVDVALHALDLYEAAHRVALDGLLLLQPTSPFRQADTLRRGIAAFEAHGGRTVIGVSPALSHPHWCYRIEGDGERMKPFIEAEGPHQRSQDLPPAYVANGAFYLIEPARLREDRTFYPVDAYPLIMTSRWEAHDIDTEWDWCLAEAMLQMPNLAGSAT